jgi:hypothetical protein
MDYYWQTGQIPVGSESLYVTPVPSPWFGPAEARGLAPDQELDILKGQAEWLEDELGAVQKRIGELEEGRK